MTPVIFEADNCEIGKLVDIQVTSYNRKNLFGVYKINKVKAA